MTYILSAVTKRPKPEKKVVQLPTLLVSVVLICPAFEGVVLDPGRVTKKFGNIDVLNGYKQKTDSFCTANVVKESVFNNKNRERNFGSFKKQQI